MGQQQLLLIVLGVIIVGVAVVAGIGMFNAGAEEATKDELVAQSMSIASNAQQFYKRPVAMGGGGNSFTTSNGALKQYEIPSKMNSTLNGTYVVALVDSVATLTATPYSKLGYAWKVTTTVTPTSIASKIE